MKWFNREVLLHYPNDDEIPDCDANKIIMFPQSYSFDSFHTVSLWEKVLFWVPVRHFRLD